jgi:hypothetical protein
MKNIVLFSTICFLFQGCTSINQPTASRALVESQFVELSEFDSFIDLSLVSALSNAETGTVLAIEDQIVVIGSKYFAATGLNCRKAISEQGGQDIYCLDGQANWFKVNKVISEYKETEMSEVGL